MVNEKRSYEKVVGYTQAKRLADKHFSQRLYYRKATVRAILDHEYASLAEIILDEKLRLLEDTGIALSTLRLTKLEWDYNPEFAGAKQWLLVEALRNETASEHLSVWIYCQDLLFEFADHPEPLFDTVALMLLSWVRVVRETVKAYRYSRKGAGTTEAIYRAIADWPMSKEHGFLEPFLPGGRRYL